MRKPVLVAMCAFALLGQAAVAHAETEAEKLIAKAKLGSVEAQAQLGAAYREGFTTWSDGSKIEKNLDEAERWLTLAAQKDIHAKAWLGGLYSSSDFDRRNDTEAAHLFAEIANSGTDDQELLKSVEFGLGEILYQECTGYLISLDCGRNKSSPMKNDQAAAHWFEKAASQGHTYAQFQLATMYENGRGVPQDFGEAAKLYEAAAAGRHEEATVMLGQLYVRMKNLPMAYMWYNIAAADSRHEAAERRDKVASRMSPEQIAEGQKLTRDYLAARKSKKTSCTWGRC
jgi:TPR repeat protein